MFRNYSSTLRTLSKSRVFKTLASGIFRTLANSEPEVYSEPVNPLRWSVLGKSLITSRFGNINFSRSLLF